MIIVILEPPDARMHSAREEIRKTAAHAVRRVSGGPVLRSAAETDVRLPDTHRYRHTPGKNCVLCADGNAEKRRVSAQGTVTRRWRSRGSFSVRFGLESPESRTTECPARAETVRYSKIVRG